MSAALRSGVWRLAGIPVGSARTSSSMSGVISKPSGLVVRKPAARNAAEADCWTVASSSPAANGGGTGDGIERTIGRCDVLVDAVRVHRRLGERRGQADGLPLGVEDRDAGPPRDRRDDVDQAFDVAPRDAEEDVVPQDVELARHVAAAVADTRVPLFDRRDERVQALVVTAEERRAAAKSLGFGQRVGDADGAIDGPDDEIEGQERSSVTWRGGRCRDSVPAAAAGAGGAPCGDGRQER